MTLEEKLLYASLFGEKEFVEELLDKGVNVNHRSEINNTALMLASKNGYTKTVKLLLERGADVHLKNNIGDTALTWASQRGNEEVIKILKDHIETKEKLQFLNQL